MLKLNKNREPRFYADLGYDRGPYEISNANGLDTITIKMRFQEKQVVVITIPKKRMVQKIMQATNFMGICYQEISKSENYNSGW